jgi:hypothetical protein
MNSHGNQTGFIDSMDLKRWAAPQWQADHAEFDENRASNVYDPALVP